MAYYFSSNGVLCFTASSKLQGDGFFVEADHTYVTNELAEKFDLPSNTILVVFDPAEDQKIEDTLKN